MTGLRPSLSPRSRRRRTLLPLIVAGIGLYVFGSVRLLTIDSMTIRCERTSR